MAGIIRGRWSVEKGSSIFSAARDLSLPIFEARVSWARLRYPFRPQGASPPRFVLRRSQYVRSCVVLVLEVPGPSFAPM